MHLFYSKDCANSRRFMDFVWRVPRLKAAMQMVDVDTVPPGTVQFVPTLVLDDQRVLVGTKAFDYLKQFVPEADIGSFDDSKGIVYSSVDDPGGAYERIQTYSNF